MTAADRRPTELADYSRKDVEKAVLGVALLVPTSGPDLLADLEPEDFCNPICRAFFVAMTEMIAAGIPIDAVTVVTRLITTKAMGAFTNQRDPGNLIHDLMSAAPSPTNGPYYKQSLFDLRYRRALLQFGQCVIALSATGDPTQEVDEQVGLALAAVATAKSRCSVVT
jgi:replicative DNA helicase